MEIKPDWKRRIRFPFFLGLSILVLSLPACGETGNRQEKEGIPATTPEEPEVPDDVPEEPEVPDDVPEEPVSSEFTEVAPPGFGDLHNNVPWSMKWWQGKLYVGTNRDWYCWSLASVANAFPYLAWIYPNRDPEMDCTPDPHDLPLQAEIWSYTPETEVWERVYQAPADVPIPESSGKYTARDIGYRGMALFHDPDGTEAMYVSGVNAQMITKSAPPPRILRTTDGEHFEAIPQDPGTLLGDFDLGSFRGAVEYDGRFWLVGSTIQGFGVLLESRNPAGGNDHFRQASPNGMPVWDPVVFNDYLYVTLRQPWSIFNPSAVPSTTTAQEVPPWEDPDHLGYMIVKTKAEGDPPYAFETVITHGAYGPTPSKSAVCEVVYRDQLYVGTDKPAEMIRLNRDDTWDLVVGTPRETPEGWKYPLSGMDSGFDWELNIHIYRMEEHGGELYAGTADNATRYRNVPLYRDFVKDKLGFDLYKSPDGWHWKKVTTTGFGRPFQMGIRVFADTPHGLFFGSFSFWEGCRIWLSTPAQEEEAGASASASFPAVPATLFGLASASVDLPPACPERLNSEWTEDKLILFWTPPEGTASFHILRTEATGPNSPMEEIGVTEASFFIDTTVQPDHVYLYAVQGEGRSGLLSANSNLSPAPSLFPPVTFALLLDRIEEIVSRTGFSSPAAGKQSMDLVKDAEQQIIRSNRKPCYERLKQFRQILEEEKALFVIPQYAEELEILAYRLTKRIELQERGILDLEDLL